MTSWLKKIQQSPRLQFILFGVLLSSMAILPLLGVVRSSTMSIYAYIIIYTVVALGLNLLLGFSGLISLGTAGFMGAGALGIGVFMNMGLPFELAVVLTLLVSAMIGAFIGLFSLRVNSIYLAIATLFVGEILRQIYSQVAIFGGEGINIGPVRFFGLIELNRSLRPERSLIFLILVIVLVVMMIVAYNIVKSSTGRALMAMSRSENAAQAMGVSILKYRLTAFITATLFATIGGILYGIYFQDAPTRQWDLNLSLFLIAMVVVGGIKSFFGMFLGVFIVHGLSDLFLKDWLGDVSFIFSGVLIIVVILFYPYGTVHIWVDFKRFLKYIKSKIDKRKGVTPRG